MSTCLPHQLNYTINANNIFIVEKFAIEKYVFE